HVARVGEEVVAGVQVVDDADAVVERLSADSGVGQRQVEQDIGLRDRAVEVKVCLTELNRIAGCPQVRLAGWRYQSAVAGDSVGGLEHAQDAGRVAHQHVVGLSGAVGVEVASGRAAALVPGQVIVVVTGGGDEGR